ncbi:Ribosome-binding factor A [Desulfovibrio sp. X2]|uniref:30S ribosome-binding factor RbfA n=1 Tax=Desulfovibrio sp. X2 TaxID=941449 RepID=UPI000358DAEB|nr:30S ribosome-binding factor RbfA [Desulfovibrio sp. X2]EPR44236.1 Ribosome-binding factor A [Desulfovibrio sp. X2]
MKRSTSRRADRMSDAILREIARLLAEEVADPRLELVTVSGVRMNADFSVAEVMLTYSGDEERHKQVEAALKKASGFLRTRLGKALQMKKTPELRFSFDDYLEDMVYERHET